MATDQSSGMAEPNRLRPAFTLSALLAPLLVAAAIPGVFVAGFYRDTPTVIATDRGSDLVTLFIVVPVLLISLIFSVRGSLRAQIVWLGVTGWTAYNYAVYAYGLQFTPMFLVHVAILSLSLFTLVIALRQVDVGRLQSQFGPLPRRIVAGYLLVVAAIFAVLWLSDAVPPSVGGGIPKRLAELHSTSNPVEVNDLAVVIPALVVGGVWTWLKRPVGYLLAGALLGVATLTLGAIVPGGPIFGSLAIDPIFAAVATVSLMALIAVLATTSPAGRLGYRSALPIGTPAG